MTMGEAEQYHGYYSAAAYKRGEQQLRFIRNLVANTHQLGLTFTLIDNLTKRRLTISGIVSRVYREGQVPFVVLTEARRDLILDEALRLIRQVNQPAPPEQAASFTERRESQKDLAVLQGAGEIFEEPVEINLAHLSIQGVVARFSDERPFKLLEDTTQLV